MTKNPISGGAIVIYGASSENIKQVYKDEAFEAGRLIARSGRELVCGGGRQGLMRSAIDGALSVGGSATGVLPSFMVARNWQHPGLTHLISTESMHERKAAMVSRAMAVIACPGGCGTFEELLEMITWRQLGLFRGQVVILNVEGYYDPLLAMMDRAIAEGFMNADHRRLFRVARTAAEAVALALEPVDESTFSQKIH